MSNPYSPPQSNIHQDPKNTENDTTSPFSPKGRFSRYSFLAWNLVLNIMVMIVAAVIMAITGAASGLMTATDPNEMMAFYGSATGLMMIVLILASLVFSIIFFVRRLHDINMNGWWSVLIFIPIVNIIFGIYVLVKKGVEGTNRFGPARATPKWEKVLGIIALIIIVLYVLVIIAGIVASIVAGGMQQ